MTLFKRVLGSRVFWLFVPATLIFGICTYTSGTPYILWLSSQARFSVPAVNNLGTMGNVVSIVSALVTTYYTDLRGKRWEPLVLAGILCLFSNLVLAIWKIPYGLKFFAYVSIGAASGATANMTPWLVEFMQGDLEARAIIIATFNTLGEVIYLVVPLVAWPVSKAPEFKGGFIWV